MKNQIGSAGTRAVALVIAQRLERLLGDLAQSEEADSYELRVARGTAGSLIDQLGSLLPRESGSVPPQSKPLNRHPCVTSSRSSPHG